MALVGTDSGYGTLFLKLRIRNGHPVILIFLDPNLQILAHLLTKFLILPNLLNLRPNPATRIPQIINLITHLQIKSPLIFALLRLERPDLKIIGIDVDIALIVVAAHRYVQG